MNWSSRSCNYIKNATCLQPCCQGYPWSFSFEEISLGIKKLQFRLLLDRVATMVFRSLQTQGTKYVTDLLKLKRSKYLLPCLHGSSLLNRNCALKHGDRVFSTCVPQFWNLQLANVRMLTIINDLARKCKMYCMHSLLSITAFPVWFM